MVILSSFASSGFLEASERRVSTIFLMGPGVIPAFAAGLSGATARITGRMWNATPIDGIASGSPGNSGLSNHPGVSSGTSLIETLSLPPPTICRVTTTSISVPARFANSLGNFNGSI